jgi:hypothetical protein
LCGFASAARGASAKATTSAADNENLFNIAKFSFQRGALDAPCSTYRKGELMILRRAYARRSAALD